jgi:DNA-directed RNA polymerase specialized sigma24 family protein
LVFERDVLPLRAGLERARLVVMRGTSSMRRIWFRRRSPRRGRVSVRSIRAPIFAPGCTASWSTRGSAPTGGRSGGPGESFTDSFTDAQLAAQSSRFVTSRSAESQALQSLPDEDIRQPVQALPESVQAVVYYADICWFAYKEIAQIEGIALGTVMSRIHRARRQLRGALWWVAQHRGYAHGDPCDVAAAH